MSQVKRLYVEKKSSYAVKAKELAEELKAYLSIEDVSDVRELIRYDEQIQQYSVFSFLMRRKNQSFVLQQPTFSLAISVMKNWRRLKNTVSIQ